MNCFDCKIPCEYSNPFGFCQLTICAKKEVGLPNGPWDKGYQPSGIQDPIKEAALNLVDAVERYMRQECLRSELAMKKDKLKELLK